jgi:hypothetical protein
LEELLPKKERQQSHAPEKYPKGHLMTPQRNHR